MATVQYSQATERESNTDERLTLLTQIVRGVVAARGGDGTILFPAGWFETGREPASLYRRLVAGVVPLLASEDRSLVVCVGMDGRWGRDQVAVPLDKGGIVALARKFYPTSQEWNEGITPAQDHLCPEGGSSRILALAGKKFYLAVCYDIFGVRHKELDNPGVDAILNLVHRFSPRGTPGSGIADFARKGLAGASKRWSCPAFAAAVFRDRRVPPNWPSGIVWLPRADARKTLASAWELVCREEGPLASQLRSPITNGRSAAFSKRRCGGRATVANADPRPAAGDNVKADTVYREMYTEMRRYRDYELNIAKWYSTFSLGYFGAVYFLLHSQGGKELRDTLAIGCGGKLLLVILGGIICLAGAYSSWYATDRYDHLRQKVTEVLEPDWSKSFKPPIRLLEPGYIIWFVPFALFAATCWILFADDRGTALALSGATLVIFIAWIIFGYRRTSLRG